MKKITRLTESDLTRIIRKVISEQSTDTENLYSAINNLIDREYGEMDPEDVKNVLHNIFDNYKAIAYRKQRGIGSVTRGETRRRLR